MKLLFLLLPVLAISISPIGGVFQSQLLPHRFQMLVELSDGVTVASPLLSGLEVQLHNLPETEK